MRRLACLLLFACSIACGPVAAQTAYVDLEQRLSAEQLRELGLTATQLALLNRYLRETHVGGPPVETARYESASGASQRDPTSLIGLADAPIHARVQGTVDGWAPGTVFALDNGQRWKVLKGAMTLRRPLAAPAIVVVPGIAGRWFLQVDEDLPKARVYRID